jgi:predicted Zn-dependent protease
MRRSLPLLAALALAACAASCTHRQQSAIETVAAEALVSPEEEAQIGHQIHADLLKKGVSFLHDPIVTGYVQTVAGRIIAEAKRMRPNVEWRVQVIDDPKTVNAFATPGGYVYVYSGLLEQVQNEGELAGVLAHEIAHVVERHAARRLVAEFGLRELVALALGKNPPLLEKVVVSILGKGALLAHTRSEETEADEVGATLMWEAGYDPHALIGFFEVLLQKQGELPGALVWLSDHPLTTTRIADLREYIADHHLEGGVEKTGRLPEVKQRLERIESNRGAESP